MKNNRRALSGLLAAALLFPSPSRAASFLASGLKSSLGITAVSAAVLATIFIAAVEGSATMDEFSRRNPGDPILPDLRLDQSCQLVGASAQGSSTRVQAGHAMLGADFEFLRYWERKPAATLDYGQAEGLIRLADRASFRADLAYGYRETTGGRGLAPLAGISLGEYLESGLGLETDLRWTDIGGAAVLGDWRARAGWRFDDGRVALFAGFRSLRLTSGHRDGPEAGLALTW